MISGFPARKRWAKLSRPYGAGSQPPPVTWDYMRSLVGSCSLVLFATALVAVPVASQTKTSQASSRSSRKTSVQSLSPEAGALSDNLYHNLFFGFSCKVPFGWVDRTADMRQGGEPGKSLVLLSTFERPPQAAQESINSAVVIAAESVSSYPGLKSAAQYFGPLTELTTAKGFKVVNEPYEYSAGGKQVVRVDFSREMGKLTMWQATLAIVARGYIVSFTFIGGSEDEVNELIEGLKFAKAVTRRR